MKIILSPAKNMVDSFDDFLPQSKPVYLNKTEQLLKWLQGKNYDELKEIWNCNDQLVIANQQRIAQMDLSRQCSCALFSYVGLVYQHLAPSIMEQSQLDYLNEHLRILSAFYGILKPMDGIRPYRLEMGCKADINLYDYWADALYQQLKGETIVNLASKEYSQCVEKYLQPSDHFVTIDFVEEVNGKLRSKATMAKMARGEMVRFMAENEIEELEQLKKFQVGGYRYRVDLSNENHLVFERKQD